MVIQVEGLLDVLPNACHSILCQHSLQVMILRSYYHEPLDAASVKIQRCWKLTQSRRLHMMRRRTKVAYRSSACAAQLGSEGILIPEEDLVTDATIDTGESVANILQANGIEVDQFGEVPT